MDISRNQMISGDVATVLIESIQKSNIKTLIIGKSASLAVGGSDATSDSLDYSDQDLGPGEIMLISALVIPTTPGLVGVDVSRNQINADVAPVLIESIKKSNIETLVIGKSASVAVRGSDASSLNYSDQDLGPGEIMLISALAIPTTAGLAEVVISGNKCFDAIHHLDRSGGAFSDHGNHDIDKDQSGWIALCNSFKGTSVQKLGFADIGLGPIGMKTLAETIPTIPGLAEVVISENKCFGTSVSDKNYGGHATPDEDEFNGEGFSAFCDALCSSNVQRLNFADIGLGPTSVKTLADAIPAIPGLVGVDISRNQISADVAPMLIESIQKSNINDVVVGPKATLVPFNNSDVTTLDFSDQDLGPAEIMLISAAIPTTPGLVEVVISTNKCFGSKDKGKYDKTQIYDIDKDQSGWIALCEAVKGSTIEKLGFSDIGMGPVGMKTLAETIPTTPGLAEVVISDNKCFGDKWKDPNYQWKGKTHDIDKDQSGWAAMCNALKGSGIQKLGFADIGLGPIGMKTLAETIPTIPGLVGVDISRNQISADVAPTLIESIQKSNIKTLVIGKSTSLAVGGSDATSLDYSDQDLGPGEIMLISSLVIPTTPGVVELVISDNKCFGQRNQYSDNSGEWFHDVDKDQSGWAALCESIKGTPIQKLSIADIGMGPVGMKTLAETIPTIPGIVEVVISGNKRFGAIHHLFGYGNPYPDHGNHDIDKDQSGWIALCNSFKGTTVQKLGFADIGLGPIGMKTLAETIPTIPGLVGVDISRNQISAYVAPMLVESIQKSNINEVVIGPKSTRVPFNNSEVTSLDFSDHGLGPAEIMLISTAILTTPGMVEVDISKNTIGVDGASALTAVLAETKTQKLIIGPESTAIPVQDADVTKLDVSNQNLGPAEIMLISAAIPTTPGVVEVDISKNSFGVDGASAFAAVLAQTKIQKLIIGPQSTVIPVHDTEVTKLDVSNQNLGPAEIMLISSTIPTTPGVAEVVISGNKCFGSKVVKNRRGRVIGQEHDVDKNQSGWSALCHAVKGSSIQKLGFADIGLGSIGMKTLAETIPTIPGVLEVVISGNKCFGAIHHIGSALDDGYVYEDHGDHAIDNDQSGWTALCNSFKGTSVQKLGFADVGLGPIGMKTLAETIPTIPGLVEVVVSNNKCFGAKDKCWKALCKSFSGTSIEKLGFADIGMGPVGMKTLAKTIPTIPGTVEVDISKNTIGVDGASALTAVLPETKIQKLIIGPESTAIPVHDADVTKLDVSNQNLGPAEIMLISAAFATTLGLVAVDISRNQMISADVAPMLIESIQKSNIKTLVIGKSASLAIGGSDATSLDYSDQDLGPGEIMLISASVIPTTPGLVEVVLSGNPSVLAADIDLLKQVASCMTVTV
eukprot:SAG11_NODE_76_length_18005_cov_6.523958_13_plen_1375_part_00